jgi:hypothetical protein
VKITREEAAANALEGQSRCPRCDKPHGQKLDKSPRAHVMGIVGRTAFGYLGMNDTCGRSWTVEWKRVTRKYILESEQCAPSTKGTAQLDGAYGPNTSFGTKIGKRYYVTALPKGSVFFMRGHVWVAVRARSFWSRNKAREWAKRWLVARVNTRGTKHREIFESDLEVPDEAQGTAEGDRGVEEGSHD